MEGKRITIEGHFIHTGWTLFQQLAALDAEIKLTANTPYPTFSVDYKDFKYLFNQNGGDVNTMVGTFTAFSFDEVKDIRDLHNLEWKDGWNIYNIEELDD